MTDEHYDFGKPKLSPHRLGVFLLLIGIVAIGIYWWNNSVHQQTQVKRLKSENKNLREKLVQNPQPSGVVRSSEKGVFKNASSRTAQPGSGKENINIEQFIISVKNASSESELDKLDYQAANIEYAVPALIQLTRQREHCHHALYALRSIDIEHTRRSANLVTELITIIDTNRFGHESECAPINRHAYSFLVALEKDAHPARSTLNEIMTADHSPWAAYACVTLKLIDPQEDIESRLVELIRNPFQTNRLIAARKLPDFADAEIAKAALRRAHAEETSESVKESILNSLHRLSQIDR